MFYHNFVSDNWNTDWSIAGVVIEEKTEKVEDWLTIETLKIEGVLYSPDNEEYEGVYDVIIETRHMHNGNFVCSSFAEA